MAEQVMCACGCDMPLSAEQVRRRRSYVSSGHARRARPLADPASRFFPNVGWGDFYAGTRCLLWTAALSHDGYGRFGAGRREEGHVYAHRWLYERWVGPVPEGCQLHHLCGDRACVNPEHLELMTKEAHREEHRPDFCPYGHPYDDENTYIYQGSRSCRMCQQRRSAEHYRRRQQRR